MTGLSMHFSRHCAFRKPTFGERTWSVCPATPHPSHPSQPKSLSCEKGRVSGLRDGLSAPYFLACDDELLLVSPEGFCTRLDPGPRQIRVAQTKRARPKWWIFEHLRISPPWLRHQPSNQSFFSCVKSKIPTERQRAHNLGRC